jgi:flagellar basal body rod protein FlgG
MGVAGDSDEETFAHNDHIAPYTGVGTTFVTVDDMGKNFDPGRLISTGNTLDFAITSKQGFFSVATPQGERFTRAGSFLVNGDGQLVTTEGYPVNGKEGPLKVQGNAVELSEDGNLRVDGRPAGGVKVVTFPFPERLQKLGGSLMAPIDPANSPRIMENPKLAQGVVESSNVNAVREMVRMIEATRSYTTMQKAMNAADEMNQKTISLAQV